MGEVIDISARLPKRGGYASVGDAPTDVLMAFWDQWTPEEDPDRSWENELRAELTLRGEAAYCVKHGW